jgi:OMF family outer membrane factor
MNFGFARLHLNVNKFILLSAAVLVQWVSAAEYSLEKLLQVSLENSSAVKSVIEEKKKVESQISQAYGSAMPSIDLSTTYQHAFAQYNPLASSGDMPSFPMLLQGMGIDTATNRGAYALGNILDQAFGSFSNMTKDNTAVVSLTLKQPIFAQGKVGIGLRIAKEYNAGLDNKLGFVKDTVRASVTKTFYSALLVKKNAEAQELSAKLNREIYRLSILRFNVGKTSEIDTIASYISMQQAEIAHKEVLTARKVLYTALIKQSGIPENYETFEITGDFPVSDFTITYEDALVRLREKNKVLQQLATGLSVQDQLVKLAKSDHYPLIAAQASVGKLSQFNSGEDLTWYDDRKISVFMTVNLFSGFGISEKVKQAKYDRTNFTYTMKQVQDGLEVGLRAACENLSVNREKVAMTGSLVKMAEKGLDIRTKMYDLGAATLTELQKTELDLKNARMAHNAALFSYYSSVVDVKLLIGE